MAECLLGLAGVCFGTGKNTGCAIATACARLVTETDIKLI
jgi:hypothetical protein